MKGNDVELPRRQTYGSCGYDFYAPEDIELTPGVYTTVDTRVCFDGDEEVRTSCSRSVIKACSGTLETKRITIDKWFMMLVPRSGLGTKYGVRFRNTTGIIDSDYRDTIKACLTCDEPCTIKKGERFMQGIIMPYGVFCDEETPTKERDGGHGSTGV